MLSFSYLFVVLLKSNNKNSVIVETFPDVNVESKNIYTWPNISASLKTTAFKTCEKNQPLLLWLRTTEMRSAKATHDHEILLLTNEEDDAAVALPLIHRVDLVGAAWKADPEVSDLSWI